MGCTESGRDKKSRGRLCISFPEPQSDGPTQHRKRIFDAKRPLAWIRLKDRFSKAKALDNFHNERPYDRTAGPTMSSINPSVLKWARDSAGLSVPEAAQKVIRPHSKGASREAALLEFENGSKEPSLQILKRMAQAYGKSIAILCLPNIPAQDKALRDYRAIPGARPQDSANLNKLLRTIQIKQELLRDALLDADDTIETPIVGSASKCTSPESISAIVMQALNFRRDVFRSLPLKEALKHTRSAAESAGIAVLFLGDPGNNRLKFSPSVFRGFAIADSIAPFIVINANDSDRGKIFTILHEAAHIAIGSSRISDYSTRDSTEVLCNDAASAILVEPDEISSIRLSQSSNPESILEEIDDFCNERHASLDLVAYRLLKFGIIAKPTWEAISTELQRRRKELSPSRPRVTKKKGGPDYYKVQHHKYGRGLITSVRDLMQADLLSAEKASMVLGVKLPNVYKMINL